MEIRKFDNWLGHRQNHIDEGLRDFFTSRSKPTAPAHTGPDEPSQVYTNQTVLKYTHEVLSRLGLDQRLEIIDDMGKKQGDFSGPPQDFVQAMMRFIAGHVLGGSRSFLNISYHDAAFILNYLDHLKVHGDRQSVAERLDITNPQSLSHWLQNHVPMAQDAIAQQGFENQSQNYTLPRRKSGPGVLKDVRIKKLVDSAIQVVNDVHAKLGTSNRRITMDIINGVKNMSDALEAMGVVVPGSPTTTPPTQSGPPGLAGRGRKNPQNP